MWCDLGNHAADYLVLLSIPGKPPFGCIPCLQKAELWCERHQQVLHGFMDGTAACFRCIEEQVDRDGAVGARFLEEIGSGKHVPTSDRDELNDWLETSVAITRQSRERCFTRALASKALRTRTSTSEVMRMIREAVSITPIFT